MFFPIARADFLAPPKNALLKRKPLIGQHTMLPCPQPPSVCARCGSVIRTKCSAMNFPDAPAPAVYNAFFWDIFPHAGKNPMSLFTLLSNVPSCRSQTFQEPPGLSGSLLDTPLKMGEKWEKVVRSVNNFFIWYSLNERKYHAIQGTCI